MTESSLSEQGEKERREKKESLALGKNANSLQFLRDGAQISINFNVIVPINMNSKGASELYIDIYNSKLNNFPVTSRERLLWLFRDYISSPFSGNPIIR